MNSLIDGLVQYYRKWRAEEYARETVYGRAYGMTFYPRPQGETQEGEMLTERSHTERDTLAERLYPGLGVLGWE